MIIFSVKREMWKIQFGIGFKCFDFFDFPLFFPHFSFFLYLSLSIIYIMPAA